MRAARAAKNCHEATGFLVDHLEKVIQDSNDSLLDYVSRQICPLLKALFNELCASQPDNACVGAGLWLLQKSGATEDVLEKITVWMREGNRADPFAETNGGIIPSLAETNGGIIPHPPARRASSLKSNDFTRARHSILRTHTAESLGTESPKSGDRRMSKRVSISLWQADTSIPTIVQPADSIAEDEEEVDSDDESDRDRDSPKAGRGSCMNNLLKSPVSGGGRLSSLISSGPSSARSSCVRDNRRRFTMAVPTLRLPMPPVEDTVELLKGVKAFKGYSEDDLRKIVAIMECHRYDLDENVVNFGAASERVHIVVDGVGKVSIPRQIGQVNKGDVFGEESLLLAGAVCPTQVEAMGSSLTTISVPAKIFNKLEIRKATLEKTNRTEKLARSTGNSRKGDDDSISQDSGRAKMVEYQQTDADRELIMLAVKNNKVLAEVLQLSDNQYDLIADNVHLISVPKGETLMRKGDTGMALYILQEGILDVCLSGTPGELGGISIRPGDSFGELALLYDTPRAATITALRDAWLWVLDRTQFRMVTRVNYTTRIASYTELIAKIPSLNGTMDKGNYDMIAGILEEFFYAQGEEICTAGEDAGFLFILFEGECEARKEDGSTRTLTKGDWIGEAQLSENIPAVETLTVTSDSATALVLDRNSLQLVTKAVHAMKKSSHVPDSPREGADFSDHLEKEQFSDNFLRRRMSNCKGQRRSQKRNSTQSNSALLGLANCGILGEGSFGSVLLLADADFDKKYGLKVLSKEQIVKESLSKEVTNERSVMALLDNDFVIRLVKTFQDRTHILFLLEAALGGELFDVYAEQDLFGRMDHARFYMGCVTLALNHLHLHRVVYRDLKLENCLLDERGYLKLTDMGIAKLVMGKTYTMCGTADYFAPETLRQSGYNRAVDWWAGGVLLFIMAAGRSPFDAPEVTQIYKNIMKGFSKVQFPANFASDLTDTIKSLCRKKPEERVPMLKGGIENLVSLPFFSGLDWERLEIRTVEPPYIPKAFDLDKVKARTSTRDLNICLESLVEWDGSMPSHGIERPGTPPASTPTSKEE